ncbi:hypothetical protein FDG2_0039 [Candidatus Protofrankia californiensis]|uniref:HTH cro/C1-type domain-containing protein n=1 Tax=Candidatus Protofrankia californiensis TaxID=1839754 RepID=A0A1C3NSR7_9ACTN|nr:hypothetical protein FDG2_0039 [Candidatus Protofrankia californiensis]
MTSRNHELPAAPAGLWDRPEMSHALDQRDMAACLKIFQKWTGATQGQIATACGMPQSHISEIINGKRRVTSLELFERLASGLDIPRRRLGLADQQPATTTTAPPETGQRTGPATVASRAAAFLTVPVVLAAGMTAETMVTASGRQSVQLLEALGGSTIDPLVLEQFSEDIARLALDYIASPPEQVIAETVDLRSRVLAMLEHARRPEQINDLYLIAGQLSGILAYGAVDLGQASAAMAHARAALLCADTAGHTDLAIWARGTQSLIARFANRHREALQYIRAGLALKPTGTGLARLTAGQAQCLAHLGDVEGTRTSLAAAFDAIDQAGPPGDIERGLFTFPRAMLHYYAGGSLVWLPDAVGAAAAEEAAATAIDLFAASSPETRFTADEMTCHVYLATARVQRGNIDGAVDALRPVLTIPAEQRVSWHRRRLDNIAGILTDNRYKKSATAVDLRNEIVAF